MFSMDYRIKVVALIYGSGMTKLGINVFDFNRNTEAGSETPHQNHRVNNAYSPLELEAIETFVCVEILVFQQRGGC